MGKTNKFKKIAHKANKKKEHENEHHSQENTEQQE